MAGLTVCSLPHLDLSRGDARCWALYASTQRHTYGSAQTLASSNRHYRSVGKVGALSAGVNWRYLMRTSIALLLTLPLFACEPESVMERSGEIPADAVENTADTIEDAREDDGEEIGQVVD